MDAMTDRKPTPPRWIVVQLGSDQNWWLEETSDKMMHAFDEINEVLEWSPAE